MYGESYCQNSGVVIAYDTRNNSKQLANVVARVLSSFNICAYLNEKACPTPELSFSVKKYGFMLGIVITASHNTKDYNGYKVYDSTGCQITSEVAKKIFSYIKSAPYYSDCLCNYKYDESLICPFNCENEFLLSILKSFLKDLYENTEKIKVVYIPLHGTGKDPVQRVLKKSGFSVTVVDE